MNLKFTKTRKVKSPNRGTIMSAGIDFFIPEFDESFKEEICVRNEIECKNKKIILESGERILLPLGIHVKMPSGWHMIFFNKGGISSKKGLDVLACVVDEDYQGEIFLSLVNTSNDIISIEEGDKIIQGVLLQTLYCEIKEIEDLNKLYIKKTERGDGAFGSTNTK